MAIKPFLLHILLAVAAPAAALWPKPTTMQSGSTVLKLAQDFDITPGFDNAPADLLAAIEQAKTYLANDQLQRLVPGRGASNSTAIQSASSLPGLRLVLDGSQAISSISDEAVKDLAERDEAYTLMIPSNGSDATISAASSLGLYRGLTTFGQLWYAWAEDTYTLEAPIDIEDKPAFLYRGFMLDTSRNFFAVSDIKRTLDAMSWVKINTLHWHITDSQSFPLVVPEFPTLSEQGAYSSSEVYSPDDIQDIVSYAAARGIDVLMEIDTPGHTAVIADAFPEHVACNRASPWDVYANEPPAGQLRLASANTTNFTATLLSSVASRLPSKMFSTGGDELNVQCYTDDPETQADLAASGRTLEEALNVFTQATHGALAAVGKTPVVWEEMVLDHNVTLSNETVVMVWISSDDAAAVAQKGFRFVHAPSDYFYLDCGAGEWIGDSPDANSWCDPFKTWQHAYTFDPLANLTESQIPLVLGGQQLLWTEQSSPENLDSIVWPRAAVSAEIFWTGEPAAQRSGIEAISRFHDLRFRMVARGVKAIPVQPQWCALRPGECNQNS